MNVEICNLLNNLGLLVLLKRPSKGNKKRNASFDLLVRNTEHESAIVTWVLLLDEWYCLFRSLLSRKILYLLTSTLLELGCWWLFTNGCFSLGWLSSSLLLFCCIMVKCNFYDNYPKFYAPHETHYQAREYSWQQPLHLCSHYVCIDHWSIHATLFIILYY